MKVSIKDFSITMDLGNNGITFDVYDNDEKFLGDLRLGSGPLSGAMEKHRLATESN